MATPVSDPLKPSREGRRLALVGAALLGLAAVSWALAHASLGAWSSPVALSIAALKATLVALFFMRLSQGTVAARFAIGIALAFIALLTAVVVTDVLLR